MMLELLLLLLLPQWLLLQMMIMTGNLEGAIMGTHTPNTTPHRNVCEK